MCKRQGLHPNVFRPIKHDTSFVSIPLSTSGEDMRSGGSRGESGGERRGGGGSSSRGDSGGERRGRGERGRKDGRYAEYELAHLHEDEEMSNRAFRSPPEPFSR